ncbi:MAG: diaminopimelate decarboxylase [Fimbriimonas sp.]
MVSSEDPRFRLSDASATELAACFGTPLYVVNERHYRARLREYAQAARAAHPRGEITFASKANSTLALLKIAHQEGAGIDVASEGELRAALAAGIPASACHLHGNNKQISELKFALAEGVGLIVLDHFSEIEQVADLRPWGNTQFVLRLAPGVDPITHEKISTGQADTKFGFNISDGSASRATLRCLELQIPLIGFHCHVGSQLLDPAAQQSGGSLITQFAVAMLREHGFRSQYLNVGGGLGVRYTEKDAPMGCEEYCRLIADTLKTELAGTGLDPVLAQEPGRSLIAESGVTLYRVGVIKDVPAAGGTKTFVSVDGGLSDNPRPVMYGSAYTVEAIGRRGATRKVTVSGKHCETDTLFPGIELPVDLAEGDLLQVLCTGAYNATMASNYNRYPRPATALIRENGTFELIQRRETWNEMFSRELIPTGLGAS